MAVITNLFPEIYPTIWDPDDEDFQLRTRAQNGFVQINTLDGVVQWGARGFWDMLVPQADREQIEDHWNTNRRLVFSLIDFWKRKIRGALIGLGNGVTTTFDLPSKNTSSGAALVIKVNGTPAAPQPTFSAGTGASGLDQVTFSAAPSNGAVLTEDADSGQRLYDVNYLSAKFSPRHREADIFTIDLQFLRAVS